MVPRRTLPGTGGMEVCPAGGTGGQPSGPGDRGPASSTRPGGGPSPGRLGAEGLRPLTRRPARPVTLLPGGGGESHGDGDGAGTEWDVTSTSGDPVRRRRTVRETSLRRSPYPWVTGRSGPRSIDVSLRSLPRRTHPGRPSRHWRRWGRRSSTESAPPRVEVASVAPERPGGLNGFDPDHSLPNRVVTGVRPVQPRRSTGVPVTLPRDVPLSVVPEPRGTWTRDPGPSSPSPPATPGPGPVPAEVGLPTPVSDPSTPPERSELRLPTPNRSRRESTDCPLPRSRRMGSWAPQECPRPRSGGVTAVGTSCLVLTVSVMVVSPGTPTSRRPWVRGRRRRKWAPGAATPAGMDPSLLGQTVERGGPRRRSLRVRPTRPRQSTTSGHDRSVSGVVPTPDTRAGRGSSTRHPQLKSRDRCSADGILPRPRDVWISDGQWSSLAGQGVPGGSTVEVHPPEGSLGSFDSWVRDPGPETHPSCNWHTGLNP